MYVASSTSDQGLMFDTTTALLDFLLFENVSNSNKQIYVDHCERIPE